MFQVCSVPGGGGPPHVPRVYGRSAPPVRGPLDGQRQLHVEPLRGEFDLDYSTVAVFNTSSFIQDAPGANVEDPNRFGPLFEDRPHVVKLFTSYDVTSRFSTAAYLRLQSRDAVGGARPRLQRRVELPRAGGQPSQPHVDQPRLVSELPSSHGRRCEHIARGAVAERLRQPNSPRNRLAAVLDLQTQSTPP